MPRPPDSTFQRTVRLLAARPYSAAEVRGRLKLSGAAEGEIADAISRAENLGYLDDNALARARSGLFLAQGYSIDLAARKLAQSGFDEVDAAAAVRSAAVGVTAEDLCRRALEAKTKGPLPSDLATRRKLGRYLIRRGHDTQHIERLLGLPDDVEKS